MLLALFFGSTTTWHCCRNTGSCSAVARAQCIFFQLLSYWCSNSEREAYPSWGAETHIVCPINWGQILIGTSTISKGGLSTVIPGGTLHFLQHLLCSKSRMYTEAVVISFDAIKEEIKDRTAFFTGRNSGDSQLFST